MATTLLLRAFRLTTWRETAYLLLGFPISIVAFVVLVVGLALGFSLLVTLVGVPILVLTAAGARALAWAERRRAALVLGEPLEGAYLTLDEPTLWRRFLTLARDRQIWKDLAWLAVLSVVGFSFGLVVLVLWPTLKERVADPQDFVAAVRRVAAGGTALDPEVVRQLVARRGPLAELTPREREVLAHMAEGKSVAPERHG